MAGAVRGERNGRRQPIGAINVTPLVDVVLVLLVVLMVASTYIVAQTLKVELPRTKTSDGKTDSPAKLSLLKDGRVRWNQRFVAESRVPALLAAAVKKDKNMALVISADRDVRHGRVVKFVDMARLAGARRFAINVAKR